MFERRNLTVDEIHKAMPNMHKNMMDRINNLQGELPDTLVRALINPSQCDWSEALIALLNAEQRLGIEVKKVEHSISLESNPDVLQNTINAALGDAARELEQAFAGDMKSAESIDRVADTDFLGLNKQALDAMCEQLGRHSATMQAHIEKLQRKQHELSRLLKMYSAASQLLDNVREEKVKPTSK